MSLLWQTQSTCLLYQAWSTNLDQHNYLIHAKPLYKQYLCKLTFHLRCIYIAYVNVVYTNMLISLMTGNFHNHLIMQSASKKNTFLLGTQITLMGFSHKSYHRNMPKCTIYNAKSIMFVANCSTTWICFFRHFFYFVFSFQSSFDAKRISNQLKFILHLVRLIYQFLSQTSL